MKHPAKLVAGGVATTALIATMGATVLPWISNASAATTADTTSATTTDTTATPVATTTDATTTAATATTTATATPAPSSSTPTQPDPSRSGHTANGITETILTGDTATKAKAAATAAEPGATIVRAETDAEGATYEVHMTKADGSQVTVKLDASFNVTSTEAGM